MSTATGTWSQIELAGHKCRLYEPPAPRPHNDTIIYLHCSEAASLRGYPAFVDQFDRHGLLMEHFDQERNVRVGAWDELSIPFAQLQLAFSEGTHATANLWILLWRAVGDRWPLPTERRPR